MAKKDDFTGPAPAGDLKGDTTQVPAGDLAGADSAGRNETLAPEPESLNPLLNPPPPQPRPGPTLKTADASIAHQISIRGKYKVAIRDYRGEAVINCAHRDEHGETVSYDFIDGVCIIPESSIEHFTDERRFTIVGVVI